MPIAKHLRHLYRGPAWQAARRRILERAGGRFDGVRYVGGAKCERCGRPDRKRVWTWGSRTLGYRAAWRHAAECAGFSAQVVEALKLDQLWSSEMGDGQEWRS